MTLSENETETQTQATESSGTAPKPSDMPGAAAAVAARQTEPAATDSETAPEGAAETSSDGDSDLARLVGALGGPEGLRKIIAGERKWENRAKANLSKAEKFDELQRQALSKEERLQQERDQYEQELKAERLERLREMVARETGVPPEQVNGEDEATMRENAEKALAWANSLRKPAQSAPPASLVTGDGKAPGRPGQITSRDELKNMTPQQILAADKEGRLDRLKGINT